MADYPLPKVQLNGCSLHVVEREKLFVVQPRYHGAAGTAAPGPVLRLSVAITKARHRRP